jgi:hypothetical protein
LATNSPSTATDDEVMLLDHDEWRTISRFVVKLRNAAGDGFLNFADVDPEFVFRFNDTKVFSVDYYMDGSIARRGTGPGSPGNTTELSKLAGDLTIDVPDRQLAGYWFYETNTWDVATNWNQVLKAATLSYTQVVPVAANNAVIVGTATVTTSEEINQLTIAEGGYLVLSGTSGLLGQLTVNDELFNDNQTPAPPKSDVVTIADWNFEDETKRTNFPAVDGYTADDGNQEDIAEISVSVLGSAVGATDPVYEEIPTDNFAAKAGGWGQNTSNWSIQFSALGLTKLELFSRQLSPTGGPTDFKVQYSTNGSDWLDIPNGNYTLTVDTWYELIALDISILENEESAFIRWLHTGSFSIGDSYIDDIEITGEEIPTGLLIASTADGTGSLIHNTNDVEATIERYIPESGYHLVSVPFKQAANPVSGWFIWSYLFNFDLEAQDWEAMGSPTGTDLFVNKGYMVYKYPGPDKWSSDTTYAMTGPMNNGEIDIPVAYYEANSYAGFNLVPNPYPSAIDWDAVDGWTKTNLNNAIWIWNEGADEPYGTGYVGNYAAYIGGTGTNGGSQFIPVGQSFFVRVSTDAAASLSVNNDARVHNPQPFFKDEVQDLLRIQAIGNNYSDEIVVRFLGDATSGFDSQYDASKMYGKSEAPQLYSITEDNRKLSINSLPYTSDVISIPVGFMLDVEGEATLKASSIDSFDSDVTIFLWDMLTDTKVNLREKPDYTFMHHPDNNSARFALLFNSAVSVDEPAQTNIQFFAVDYNLHISIPDEMQERFDLILYNTSGQAVFRHRVHSGHSVITVPVLGHGVYIARLVSGEHSMVRKVFLK